MAVMVYTRLIDVTPEQYHEGIAAIQESLDGETPSGARFHAAHVVDETDIQIFEVWDSEEEHQAFVETYVFPLGMEAETETFYHPVHSEVDI